MGIAKDAPPKIACGRCISSGGGKGGAGGSNPRSTSGSSVVFASLPDIEKEYWHGNSQNNANKRLRLVAGLVPREIPHPDAKEQKLAHAYDKC